MQPAAVIPFPTVAIAPVAPSSEDKDQPISAEDLVADLVEDLEIRTRITREYTEYFTSKQNLIRHWLSILDEHGREETESKLRQIVSEFMIRKTDDERTARAYHGNCAKLFNVFIDALTSRLLQEIETQHPKNASPLDLSPNNHVGKQVRYILKTERIRWPEGMENAVFIKTRIRLLDIKYRKNSEVLVRDRDPQDSFFDASPNHKYWTVGSLRGKSKTKGPIILDANQTILDGHHRLIDAAWNEEDFIDAYMRIKPCKETARK